MPSQQEWQWLSGLLEGEGSWFYCRGRPTLQLQMNDRDVVEHAALLTGGNVGLVMPRGNVRRPSHRLRVPAAHLAAVTRNVSPWLGIRRTSRCLWLGLEVIAQQRRTISWLAGLLEGEGCFDVRGAKGNRRPCLRVRLGMVDEDVVLCASGFFGGSTVRASSRPARPREKTMYYIGWNGAKAEDAMCAVRPFMGKRRSRRVDELLSLNLSHHPREGGMIRG